MIPAYLYIESLILRVYVCTADGETSVELLIYELWPSFLPVYVGRYLGAYHTGISANNKDHAVSMLHGELRLLLTTAVDRQARSSIPLSVLMGS